jgi:hypothetical protein
MVDFCKGINMVRVYLLTQEKPSMSKVREKSKKYLLTTTRVLRKNLLLAMMAQA